MKKKVIKAIWLLLLFFILPSIQVLAQSQDTLRLDKLKHTLEQAIRIDSTYAEKINISVNKMPLDNLIRSIAAQTNTNINIKLTSEVKISCNFKNIRFSDFLYFICEQYDLSIDISQNIIKIFPYNRPPQYSLKIAYDTIQSKVSFNFINVPLEQAAQSLSEQCGVNVIISKDLFSKKITAFGHNMKFEDALLAIVSENSLKYRQKNLKTWLLYTPSNNKPLISDNLFSDAEGETIKVDSIGRISATIKNIDLEQILREVCTQLKINYFFSTKLIKKTSIKVNKVSLTDFFNTLFIGTSFSWKEENGIYLFGEQTEQNSFSVTKVVPMKYRAVDKVENVIPKKLKDGLNISTFPDLNCLILCGGQQKVENVCQFLTSIDRKVPLISIDIIIVDSTNSNEMDTGISSGLGTSATTTSGSLSPGIDFSLGGSSVNSIINSFNGFGSINLGRVTKNFYLGLKFLEERGKINIRSTPRLATLNGQKASLKSGEKKYYKETTVNYIGTDDPVETESYEWKPVEANFTLDILPYVSQDSTVTLKIDISQTDFSTDDDSSSSDDDDDTTPPETTTRSFNSIVNVKNAETILLGGIEKNTSIISDQGLPFIARIPVLKWIFGSHTKSKTIQKLSIFIKPTIIK